MNAFSRWSEKYSKQPEIRRYMQRAADYFDVTQHIRLGERVIESKWSDKTHLWTVKTDKGNAYTANFVLGGTGALHKPLIPDFKG